jgi:hypothetical protein
MPPPGDRAAGGVRIPVQSIHDLTSRQLSECTPFERVMIQALKDLHGEVLEQKARTEDTDKRTENFERDFAAHTKAEEKKATKRFRWQMFASPLVIVAIIGGVTQWQVAKLGAVKDTQSSYAKEQQHQKDLETVAAKFDATLTGIRVELEQQRRGYPDPLHQDAKVKSK